MGEKEKRGEVGREGEREKEERGCGDKIYPSKVGLQ
jgi:hypothetical protein